MSTGSTRADFETVRPWLVRILSVAIVYVIWTKAAEMYGTYLVSTPETVAETTVRLFLDGTFIDALIASGRIMFGGLLLGILVGIPAGMLLGTNDTADWMANPFVTLFYILPPAGLVPLFIIWFGIGFTSKVLLTFVFAVIPIVITVREGAKNAEDEYLEVGRSMGASPYEEFRHIVLPGTIPYIVAGIRHGIARAIIGGIVAEIFLSAVGFGVLILESTTLFGIKTTISTLFVLALLSLVLTEVVRRVELLMFPWRAE